MTPAERLKSARKALGLTDRQMAAKLGLRGENAKDDLRKMEDGMREVTGPVLVAAEALITIRDLLDALADPQSVDHAIPIGKARRFYARRIGQCE